MARIEFNNVSKRYPGQTLPTLNQVNLVIEDGEFCVFVGPSGCGKSTLLRMVAGLETVTSGDLLFDGQRVNDAEPIERGVAMVFQSYALYPHMTVAQNMGFGLKVAGMAPELVRQKVTAAAEILQLTPYLDRLPKALSGGQRQRVAIGRAIVKEPKVFLFDEPLSNLDAALRVQTRLEIAKLHRDLGRASMIYVTHDQVEAMTLAHKIVLLHTGDLIHERGSIAQVGTPMDLYHRPCSTFVAEFIGSPKMNLIPGVLTRIEPGRAWVRLEHGPEVAAAVDAQGLAVGAAVQVGVRPEHLVLAPQATASSLATWQAEVRHVESLGDASYLYLQAAGAAATLITLKLDGDCQYSAGASVTLGLAPEQLHLFDSKGMACPRTV